MPRDKKLEVKNGLFQTRVQNQSVDIENRTVVLEWSYGTKGKRQTIFGDYFEELVISDEAIDMKRLKSGAPLLAVHDQFSLDSVIGVVEDAWLEGDKGVARVRFAKDEISERVFQKVTDGILKNVSVGYNINEWEEIHSDESDIPTIRITKWEPGEISLVPIGFDHLAQIRSKKKEENINQLTKMENDRMPKSKENQVQSVEPQETRQAEQPTSNVDTARMEAETSKRIEEARKAEQKRCLEIRKSVKEAGLSDEIAERYIENGQTLDQVRFNVDLFKKHQESNRESEVQSATPQVEVGTENQEARREGIANAVLHSQDPKSFELDDKGKEFAGQSLLRMMETHIERKSFETLPNFVERVMTSSDLPEILANVATKTAQRRYELAPKTFQAWTTSGTLRDFKESTQVRGGDIGSLKKMNEAGEYEQSNIGEEAEKAKLEKYGVMHSFSDIMLINDDLDMIMDIAREAGVAQARLDNKLSYEALTTNPTLNDGVALFDAAHGNLGTAGAIGETTFSEAFELMRTQQTVDERDFLNLAPAYLVCGPAQETAAKKFLAVIQPNQASDVNIFSQSVQLIVDAQLTGNQYYFVANPMLIDTVKVNRLQGQENVRVASRTNWRNDAIELKLTYAVQAKAMDFRGLVKNAGQ